MKRTWIGIVLAAGAFGGGELRAGGDPLFQLPGTQIGAQLPAGFEPSGVAWHPRLQRLFVASDDGRLARLSADGTDATVWTVGGDLEGVCIADPATDFIYLGDENPDAIKEFRITPGKEELTRTFLLTDYMQSSDPNQGLEGVAFVPDPESPEGGAFCAGLQQDGRIFRFELSIRTSETETEVTPLGVFATGRGDLADLHFHADNGVLYALYDAANVLRAMTPAGELVVEWTGIPGNDQEGFCIVEGDAYIAEDPAASHEVWRYRCTSAPTAQAGSDAVVVLPPGMSKVSVRLDGTRSTDDGTIVSYAWYEGDTLIATGPMPAVNLGPGWHTIVLKVTDDFVTPLSDTDSVTVAVISRWDPRANRPR